MVVQISTRPLGCLIKTFAGNVVGLFSKKFFQPVFYLIDQTNEIKRTSE